MEELLAYLAGCMDSDGYFTIRKDSWAQRTGRRRSTTFEEQIGLRQVTPQVPTLLKETFGGCLYISKPTAKRGKPLFAWHVESRKAALAVAALRPHLRIKTAQADTILRLRAHKEATISQRRQRGTYEPMPDTVLAIREDLRTEIRTLNAVGI